MGKARTVPPAAAILRASIAATDRTQREYARDVLGVTLSGLTKWLGGEPCMSPIVRLAWLLEQRPEMADEIEREFS